MALTQRDPLPYFNCPLSEDIYKILRDKGPRTVRQLVSELGERREFRTRRALTYLYRGGAISCSAPAVHNKSGRRPWVYHMGAQDPRFKVRNEPPPRDQWPELTPPEVYTLNAVRWAGKYHPGYIPGISDKDRDAALERLVSLGFVAKAYRGPDWVYYINEPFYNVQLDLAGERAAEFKSYLDQACSVARKTDNGRIPA